MRALCISGACLYCWLACPSCYQRWCCMMELCTRYPRIECRQAQWNACEIQHELLLLGKYHFIAVTACDNAQSWHPPPILRKSREICENIRIFPPEALQNQFIKATTRFAPSNHTTNFECSHTMEIDIDLPFKPVTTSYNSTPFISSPSSKKKRKLSTSSPTNNPRTTVGASTSPYPSNTPTEEKRKRIRTKLNFCASPTTDISSCTRYHYGDRDTAYARHINEGLHVLHRQRQEVQTAQDQVYHGSSSGLPQV